MTLTTKPQTQTQRNLFSSRIATENSRSRLVFSGALKNPELCEYQSSVPSLAVCTERRALELCSHERSVPCACVSEERRAAFLLALLCSLKHAHRTMFQHLHPTQHARCRTYIHACKEAAAAKKKKLPINLKYDTCIVKSTNREEETEKIPFNGRRTTKGRGGYSDKERQKQRQRAPQHLGTSHPSFLADRAEEQQSKNVTLYSSFLGHHSLTGANTKWTLTNVGGWSVTCGRDPV